MRAVAPGRGPLEAARAFSDDYLQFGSAATKNAMDTFSDQMFSSRGLADRIRTATTSISLILAACLSAGYLRRARRPNGLARFRGYTEGCDMWPAVRFVEPGTRGPVKGPPRP